MSSMPTASRTVLSVIWARACSSAERSLPRYSFTGHTSDSVEPKLAVVVKSSSASMNAQVALLVGIEIESEHAAEIRHLLARERVAGIVG